jgi:hypothetical protein
VVRAQVRGELALGILEADQLLLGLPAHARLAQQPLELRVGGVALGALVDLGVVLLLVERVERRRRDRRSGEREDERGPEDPRPSHGWRC